MVLECVGRFLRHYYTIIPWNGDGMKINLEIMVSLLILSLHFSLSNILSKKNNRNKMVRVTWMNALSLFVRKNTRNKVRVYKGTRSLNDETLVKV